RLPSLEWLEAVNGRSLGAAALLVALGFFTGVVTRLAQRGRSDLPWTDPVVLSLAGMLLWLVAAEVFRLVYPAASRGRKVAYLTVAAFVFLLITLASFTLSDSLHRSEAQLRSGRSVDLRYAAKRAPGEIAHRTARPGPADGGGR
ncbi:MAG: hypothetical protein AAF961_19110, partial [Planctomycetota bacterium]